MPRPKEVLNAFGIPNLEMDGYEADDLLGTAAREASKHHDLQTIILTGDRDALQLVTGHVKVLAPLKGITETILYDEQKVAESMGVKPTQIIDYKALCGDSSDNIPGAPGIGPKQARELINKYNTLEELYKHLQDLPPGQQKKLEKGRESAFLSKHLVTIQQNAPVRFDLEDFHTHKVDYQKVHDLFQELEFKSLLKMLDQHRDSFGIANNAEQQSLF
jgi:DNA polymerase-1